MKHKKPTDFFELSESSESDTASSTNGANGSSKVWKELYDCKRVDPRDMNPLEWCQWMPIALRGFRNFAWKFLCVQATSLPSVRLFSKSGNIACLAPKTVNYLIFPLLAAEPGPVIYYGQALYQAHVGAIIFWKTIMWKVFPVHNELITSAGLSIIISKWRLIIDFKDHYQFPVLVQTHCNNYITICHCLCTHRLAISAITFT